MIRELMLALTILAVATGPVQAAMPTASVQAREHDGRGEHERFGRGERFERGEHSRGFRQPYRYGYAYEPRCYWENAHWIKQVYPHPYGGYAYVPQYIPGQWVCY